jgi:hypothetical protein
MSTTGACPVGVSAVRIARKHGGGTPLVLTGKPNGPLRECLCYGERPLPMGCWPAGTCRQSPPRRGRLGPTKALRVQHIGRSLMVATKDLHALRTTNYFFPSSVILVGSTD